MKQLYVGNLEFSVTAEELRALFAGAGVVEAATIGLPDSPGNARGFAFVEMATEEGATQAIELLHGREWHGRRLNVKRRPDPEQTRGFARGGGMRRFRG